MGGLRRALTLLLRAAAATALEILLLYHDIAVDVPRNHEWNKDQRDEQAGAESKFLVALAVGAVAVHADG